LNAGASIADQRNGQSESVLLSVNACLSAMRPGVPCTACSDLCPEGAIQIAERTTRIDPSACSDCGRCAGVCPTGAISAPAFHAANLFECSRTRRKEQGARIVSCLGGLSPAVLRYVLAQGDVTLIDRGWCAACPVSGAQAEPWADAVTTVNAEAETLGIAARIRVRRTPIARWRARPAPRGRSENPARRAVFARFAQAAQVAPPADPLAGLPGTVAAPGPRRRAVQLAALAGGAALPKALFPALSVTAEPPDLNALARLCPTGALRVSETDTQAALGFDATVCIACGDCTRTGALTLAADPHGVLDGPELLITQSRATCTRCRGRFSPMAQEITCKGCARDTELAALAHGLRRR
jgi:ferredoxin